MGSKILIVEDNFIEANDLQLMLESAGHEITGVAKSYDEACELLDKEKPDIVLLDIFLKGELTGIDLGLSLSQNNVPFIYLSANSNESTLDAAILTQPNGFLVKPFRPRDVLTALDIAQYRHQHQTELIHKREHLLTDILGSILDEQSNTQNKLLRVAQAFKPYIPFDYIFIDVNITSSDLNSLISLKRTGYDEYIASTGWQIIKEMGLDYEFYNNFRVKSSNLQYILLENGENFEEACKNVPFLRIMKDQSGVQSRIVVPLVADNLNMSVRFYSKDREIYLAEHIELLNPLRKVLSMVIENIGRQIVGGDAFIGNESKSLVPDKIPKIKGIVGCSTKLLQALDLATQVANFDTSVLILGETGVGKEGLVQAIHHLSSRNKKPLIKINCGAIPALLMESELFGHEKGSFTGAHDRQIGKFEQAQGGTIFLDEIGELPLDMQVKLLRVLQEKELERIGGRTTIRIDVRVVAATNRDLYKDAAEGRFRMDLFYRINVFPIVLAPLRERIEDIPLLASYFLQQHALKSHTEVKKLSQSALQQLMNYSWPGNIRELLHLIERSIVLSSSNIISRIDMPVHSFPSPSHDELNPEPFRSIAEVERDHIIAALKLCNGRVSGKGGAAEMLNLPSTTLTSKMKKLGISWRFIH